ncbi:MAG: hypothetical protein ACLRSD_13675 [Oscillibacter sp.]
MKKRLALSLIFTIPLFYLSMGHMMGWPLPACFLGMENAMTFAFTQFCCCCPSSISTASTILSASRRCGSARRTWIR